MMGALSLVNQLLAMEEENRKKKKEEEEREERDEAAKLKWQEAQKRRE
tara:strand:+ start:2366 stop:2509 length:144 start_codon:yes stop_codon:yes gene_type:complete